MPDFGHELHYFARWEGDRLAPVRAGAADFWRGLNPGLPITPEPFAALAPCAFAEGELGRAAAQIRREGYLQVGPGLEPQACRALADGLLRLVAAGYHPLFLSVYDAFWQAFARMRPVAEAALGSARLLADHWVWCVGPGHAPAGWAPHRDYRVAPTVEADGSPRLLTLWLPFTDATPENGCIRVLPAPQDPHYRGMASDAVGDPASARALPARAGSALGWSAQLLHWGGACAPGAPAPRISAGIFFERQDHALPRPEVRLDRPLPFEDRLRFVAGAFLRYHPTFGFPERLLQFVNRHRPG